MLPIVVRESTAGRADQEFIAGLAKRLDDLIQRAGHRLRIMACDVLAQRLRHHATARLVHAARQLVRLLRQFVGDGYRCFHTISMTPGTGRGKPGERFKKRAPVEIPVHHGSGGRAPGLDGRSNKDLLRAADDDA